MPWRSVSAHFEKSPSGGSTDSARYGNDLAVGVPGGQRVEHGVGHHQTGRRQRRRRRVEAVDVGFEAVAQRPTRHGVTDIGVHADFDVAFLDASRARSSAPRCRRALRCRPARRTWRWRPTCRTSVSAVVSAVVSSLASSSLPPHAAAISEKLTSAASPYLAARRDGRVRICTPPEWILAECVTGVTLRGTLVLDCFTA